jgi:N6-L-threonylcarbamoyladenine synthase
MSKLEKAVKETKIQTVVIAGGVSANSELRKRLLAKKENGWQVSIPKKSYCTDNAAMIAMAGYFYLAAGLTVGQDIAADPRLKW